MSEECVRVARDDGVILITIDRPRSLNAINRQTSRQLHAALDTLEADDGLGVGVLTGAGRAFCAGSDIKETSDNPAYDGSLADGNVTSITRRKLHKPLIAAVNGLALGGGTELVLACDLAVASPTATFGLPEVRHGLVAAAGGLVRGPRQLPLKIVLDLALTADPITAQQALTWGLVSRLADDPVEAARQLAHRIAGMPRMAMLTSRRAIHGGLEASLDGPDSAWDRIEPDLRRVLHRDSWAPSRDFPNGTSLTSEQS